MVLFLNDRIFVYKIGKKEIKLVHTIELEHFLISINLIDQAWIYALQEDKNDRSEGGCFVYDMYRLIKYNKINQYELTKTINGKNNILNFSIENQRLCMIQDYQVISVIPSLHSSRINFFGM